MRWPGGAVARLHTEADDAAAVFGEDGGGAGYAAEFGEVDDSAGVVRAGDELLVVGEGALDELGDDLDVAQAEEHLAALGGDDEVDGHIALDEALDLLHGAGGDDGGEFLLDGFEEGGVVDGEAEAVGGGEG